MITLEEARQSRFVLPEDAVLSPVLDLPRSVRSFLQYKDSDYALTRKFSRGNTKLLSKDTGLLLEQFRTPKTLVDGILAFSDLHGAQAKQILDHASSILFSLAEQDCLTVEGSEQSRSTKPIFLPGDEFLEFRIMHCCHLIADTEVYQIRDGAGTYYALKIARPGHGGEFMASIFERESRILAMLDGRPAPKLKQSGDYEDRPYLIMEWLNGMPLDQLIQVYQKKGGHDVPVAHSMQIRNQRLKLSAELAGAYAVLHRRGCVHGDVHPRNVLVLEDDTVRIIDFGWGRVLKDDCEIPRRAGVSAYYEPELAACYLDGSEAPPASLLGEQYSLGVMIYELLCSEHCSGGQCLPLSADFSEQLRQIVEDVPSPLTSYFERHDPRLDVALAKALSKLPERRYESTQQFHQALVAVSTVASNGLQGTDSVVTDLRLGSQATRAEGLIVRQFVDWCDPTDAWFEAVFRRHPACSIKFGGAGIAYALLRIASRFESPEVLALADLWISKTQSHIKAPHSFHGREIDINAGNVGYICPLHSPTGVHLVQAMVCEAMGDFEGCQTALFRFVEAARAAPCENPDLTIGRTGVLLSCAIVMERFARIGRMDLRPIRDLGDYFAQDIWTDVESMGPIVEARSLENLGMAHGWAGLCYGALRWHSATGTDPTPKIRDRIDELSELGIEYRNGIRWPYSTKDDFSSNGWCNGHAGFVHLWIEAAKAYQDDRYLNLAEAAAISTWQDREGVASLCCGSAGKAYAFMSMYNASNDRRWLSRAEVMGQQAVDAAQTGYSLYKSMGGIVVMASDLSQPEFACQPIFGREG